MEDIINKINDPTLNTFSLYDKQIGALEIMQLANALKVNSTLHTLNLDGNSMGIVGITQIADVIRVNSTLHTLDLSRNQIENDGVM